TPVSITGTDNAVPAKRISSGGAGLLLRLPQLTLLAGILGLWEAAVRSGAVDECVLPKPSGIAVRVWELASTGELLIHLYTTLVEMLGGFILGAAFGVLCGMLLALTPRLAAILDPYIVVLNGLPRAALAPLFVVWLGIG